MFSSVIRNGFCSVFGLYSCCFLLQRDNIMVIYIYIYILLWKQVGGIILRNWNLLLCSFVRCLNLYFRLWFVLTWQSLSFVNLIVLWNIDMLLFQSIYLLVSFFRGEENNSQQVNNFSFSLLFVIEQNERKEILTHIQSRVAFETCICCLLYRSSTITYAIWILFLFHIFCRFYLQWFGAFRTWVNVGFNQQTQRHRNYVLRVKQRKGHLSSKRYVRRVFVILFHHFSFELERFLYSFYVE